MTRSTAMFLKDFTVLDYAFIDSSQGLRGESFYVSAEITGRLDHQGFVLDFSRAKKILKSFIDENFDHRLLIPMQNPRLVESLVSSLEKTLVFSADKQQLTYRAPLEAFCPIDGLQVDANIVAETIAARAKLVLPSNIEMITISLTNDFSLQANYRYTHGLRYHDGNCQRLFHGHRNPVEVWQRGLRLESLEFFLASYFADVHFVAADNLVNRQSLDLPLEERQMRHQGLAEIRYRSTQGDFFALLPAKDIIILPQEPSVENIASLALRILQKEKGVSDVSVRAYEGLNKGALAH